MTDNGRATEALIHILPLLFLSALPTMRTWEAGLLRGRRPARTTQVLRASPPL